MNTNGTTDENASINPAPPDLPNLTWRPISQGDLDSIVELARACLLVDGGLPFLFEPETISSRYFPGGPGAGIGSFTLGGLLAACATAHTGGDHSVQQATIAVQVHPDLRNKGLGDYLMRWSQAQALMAGAVEPPWVLQITTESLTEPAHRLYSAHGL